jgi:lipopolysaccharide transport system permease protein
MPPDVTAPEMHAPAVAHPTTAPTDHPAPRESEAIETVIEPSRGWIGVNWGEMLRARELLYFLIWRDIKVRYKQAVLGAGWAIIQPVLSMIIFTVVFGVGLSLKRDLPAHVPYAIFVYCGLLPWQLFATALSMGGMSLLAQQNIITKIYFPRLYVPTAVVGGALLDMAISFVIVAILFMWYGIVPPLSIVFLPLLIALTVMLSLGVAYLFSALTVTYRDFRFLVPFLTQVWMWLSFIAFPVPEQFLTHPKWRWVLTINPMYGIIAGYRKVLLGMDKGWNPTFLIASIVITTGLFVIGLFYFRRTERRFADIA